MGDEWATLRRTARERWVEPKVETKADGGITMYIQKTTHKTFKSNERKADREAKRHKAKINDAKRNIEDNRDDYTRQRHRRACEIWGSLYQIHTAHDGKVEEKNTKTNTERPEKNRSIKQTRIRQRCMKLWPQVSKARRNVRKPKMKCHVEGRLAESCGNLVATLESRKRNGTQNGGYREWWHAYRNSRKSNTQRDAIRKCQQLSRRHEGARKRHDMNPHRNMSRIKTR